MALNALTFHSVSIRSRYMSTDSQRIVGGVLVGTGLWVTIIMIMRNVLKCLLSWHGWMHARHGSVSWSTRAWLVSRWVLPLPVALVWQEGDVHQKIIKYKVFG